MCSCTVWYHKVSRSLMSHVWYVAHAVGCEALVCLIACCRLSDKHQTAKQQIAMQSRQQLGQVVNLQSTLRRVAESGIPALERQRICPIKLGSSCVCGPSTWNIPSLYKPISAS